MNKYFTNRRAGIKRSALSKGITAWVLGWLLVLAFGITAVHAADLTYTQPLQNVTLSLTGQGITSDTYFVKEDYWDVQQAKLIFHYQVSQLADQRTSDITVVLNGVKFASFRPKNAAGLQTETIQIPLRLLAGSNHLQFMGQVLTTAAGTAQRVQTPANWLTVYPESNVNFVYALKPPEPAIRSFYAHFSGMDTISNGLSGIAVPQGPRNAELTAATYALAGYSRVMTNEQDRVPIAPFGTADLAKRVYQVVIARADRLPASLRGSISQTELAKGAVIRTVYRGGTYYLVLTARTDALLIKAARFAANQELMTQTRAAEKTITAATPTYSSSLQDNNGHYQLTAAGTQLTGAGRQSAAYFVRLPMDQTNAAGSQVRLTFRYAQNLDFARSLVTVYINDTPIGSQHLRRTAANQATLALNIPAKLAVGDAITVRVAFDLALAGSGSQDNDQTPWAYVAPQSELFVRTKPVTDQLFSNYPSLFLKNNRFNQIAIVRPRTMTPSDFATLTNIVNLLGNFAKSNTGEVVYYTGQPAAAVLANHNVIAFGTPRANSYIHALQPHLYFQFNKTETGFVSNEKLSIEAAYGRTLGTAQLLRSPVNKNHVVLVVTGGTPQAAYLGSTQINFQKNISQHAGDLIAVDSDNQLYNYRFKKTASPTAPKSPVKRLLKRSSLVIFLTVAAVIFIVLAVLVVLLLRKYGRQSGKGREE